MDHLWLEIGSSILLAVAVIVVGLVQQKDTSTDQWIFWYIYIGLGLIGLLISLLLWSWIPIFTITLLLVAGLCVYGYYTSIPTWFWIFFTVAVITAALTTVLYYTRETVTKCCRKKACECKKVVVTTPVTKCCNKPVCECKKVTPKCCNKTVCECNKKEPLTMIYGDNGRNQGSVLAKTDNAVYSKIENKGLDKLARLTIPTDQSLLILSHK